MTIVEGKKQNTSNCFQTWVVLWKLISRLLVNQDLFTVCLMFLYIHSFRIRLLIQFFFIVICFIFLALFFDPLELQMAIGRLELQKVRTYIFYKLS